MERKAGFPGFWMSALLTFMAVMIQMVLWIPLGTVEGLFARGLHKPLDLTGNPFVLGCVNIVAFGTASAAGLIMNRAPGGRVIVLRLPGFVQFLAIALTVLGADLLLSELDNFLRSVVPRPDWLVENYRKLMSPENGLPGRLFLLVVVAPVTEELLFRGVILRGLLSRFPVWAAIALSAFLFAAGHVNPWQAIGAFWIGVALGWFYLRTRSLMPCILAHAFSNGMSLLFTAGPINIPGLTPDPDPAKVDFQPWWLDLLGALCFLLGVILFRARTAQPPLDEKAPAPPEIPPSQNFQSECLPPVIEAPSVREPPLS